MKKIFAALFLAASLSIFAQNRFFYEYRFISDSTNKADVKNELMALDIGEKGSAYYNYYKYLSDSALVAGMNNQARGRLRNIDRKERYRPGIYKTLYKVIKEYPDFTTYLSTRISSDRYKIKENQKPDWKILPDTQRIGAYSTQKALTSYGGRNWIAWFSTDLPFQEGPYKFYGLPGLIIKIEDTTGSHSMTLVGNKKITGYSLESEPKLPANILISEIGGKEIEITKDQFRKAWKAYLNDPTKNMRRIAAGSPGDNTQISFKYQDTSGNEISEPSQVFRIMEKNTRERLAKDNNPIEPDILK